jgi:drug/metabolite transporter (DMT)-like permease
MNSVENKYWLGIFYAALAGFMWAILAIAMKVAVQFMDGLTISWFRFAFSFCSLFLYLKFKNPEVLSILKRPPLKASLASLFLLGNYVFYIQGVKLTTPSLVQVMIQLAPLTLVMIGVLIFKEELKKRQIFGMLLSGLGFFLFYSDQFLTILNTTHGPEFKLGAGLVIIAAISWAIYGALQKVLLKKFSTNHINLILFGTPSLFLLPWVQFSSFATLVWWQWLLVLFLGLNTIIAYGAVSEAFKILPTSKVSMIITLNPIITILLMTILYSLEVTWIHAEKINSKGYLGALFVVLGALIVLYRPDLKRKSNS